MLDFLVLFGLFVSVVSLVFHLRYHSGYTLAYIVGWELTDFLVFWTDTKPVSGRAIGFCRGGFKWITLGRVR